MLAGSRVGVGVWTVREVSSGLWGKDEMSGKDNGDKDSDSD